MPESSGRDLTIALGTGASSTTITGVRTKSVSINNEPVDVTNDDDSGWRDYLDEPGQKSIEITVEGIFVDDAVRAALFSATDISETVTVTFSDGGDVTGVALITAYSETGEYNGAVTFTATFQSKGAWTYTAAA